MATTCSTVLLLLLCGLASAKLPLPSYIKPCAKSDPNFKACTLKSARDTIPHVMKGDRKYKVPVLDPLKLDRLEVDDGHGPLGLAFIAQDVTILGVKDTQINDVDINLRDKHVTYDIFFPRLEMQTKYNISGRILVLPVVGSGDGNITLMNLHLKYDYNFTLEMRDGEEYFIPGANKLNFNTTRLYVYLDNLFNGDKLLGDSTNKSLDENWEELLKSVGPIVAEAMGEVMKTILTNIFELVPYHVAFPI